jgi:hypothetical protein
MLLSDKGVRIMIKQVTSSETLIAFVPRVIEADENPILAGFPANICYMGKRDETGVTYAIYLPDPTTFAEEELCRQMIYRPEVKNDFWLRVAMHRNGKVETFKYCGERLICGATGHDFNSAMIHMTMLGLAPDEPPTSKFLGR